MLEQISFQTRARTIDHLGREQIADCPTAISELWKNSYDAYAREVTLHIFGGDPIVAAICDDGHGMSRDEFIGKWLVIGTESKLAGSQVSVADRNGLSYRTRQGKKGIGRLSAAYLGNLMLLLSKRKELEFVAALIDWRIFENPFLVLSDIRIPIVTFAEGATLWKELPQLYDAMMSNVWGDSKSGDRTKRITEAWQEFDVMEKADLKTRQQPTTREKIEATLINEAFSDRHVSEWSGWPRAVNHGTAMLISGVIPDIQAQLHPNSKSAYEQTARKNFRDTLWSFVDPFSKLAQNTGETCVKDFETSVVGWKDGGRISIIEHLDGFESNAASNLEHTIDGAVEEDGCFRGRIKAFGKWLPEPVEIQPDNLLPSRSDSRVGGFDFYVGSMEFLRANSSHSDEEFRHLSQLLEQHSGMMVFRDGFRVMPYGRIDSDYFGVEERRSKSAGREFWNHRQMLGRIAISSDENPNLKDKAGREGIIDNQAAKAFRSLVIHILMTCARRYFGSSSDIRKATLPTLNDAHSQREKEKEREKLLEQRRRNFRSSLQRNAPLLAQLNDQMASLDRETSDSERMKDESTVLIQRQRLSEAKQRRSSLILGPAPVRLAPKMKQAQADYKAQMQEVDDYIRATELRLAAALESISPRSPREIIKAEIGSQERFLRRRLWGWGNTIKALLEAEQSRILGYIKARVDLFLEQATPLENDVQNGSLSLSDALALIERVAQSNDRENQSQLAPIVSALESLAQSIDIELLAGDSSEEYEALRGEVDRLNALAQLGITVEIIDHELAGFSSAIAHGLQSLPAAIKDSRAFQQVQTGYEGLAGRLRFLSPLKLSGEPDYRSISGKEIGQYLRDFFQKDIASAEFELNTTEEFDAFGVNEQRARLFPIFINLVNNARFWLHQRKIDRRQVKLSVVDENVIVSDNGPGIPREDLGDLFKLFFTRRQGGRGIGLYLCRANLAAGGHRISYIADESRKVLPGANFSIEFRGATFQN